MIAAAKGYRAILTMPDKTSAEKQKALQAFGAEIVVCPTDAPPDSPRTLCEEGPAPSRRRRPIPS